MLHRSNILILPNPQNVDLPALDTITLYSIRHLSIPRSALDYRYDPPRPRPLASDRAFARFLGVRGPGLTFRFRQLSHVLLGALNGPAVVDDDDGVSLGISDGDSWEGYARRDETRRDGGMEM